MSVLASDLQCNDIKVVGDDYDFIAGFVIVAVYCFYWFWIKRHCIRLCQTGILEESLQLGRKYSDRYS